MALRIQNNIDALNAHNYLQKSNDALSKSLEKLSSGFRINRASDDAAGLSIAEGMRAKIASLRVASRNTSEASSLVQTAEGGMNEISNMLVRLKELATQSSSANAGTDRDKLQAEASQLLSEIDRIANTTRYAGTVLLTGGYGNSVSASNGMGAAASDGLSTANINVSGFDKFIGSSTLATITFSNTSGTDNSLTAWDGITTQSVSINNTGAQTVSFSAFGISLKLDSNFSGTGLDGDSIQISKSNTGDPFQVTEKAEASNQISLKIDQVDTTGLGINTLDVSTLSGATTALSNVDTAISNLNSYRGNLGAIQNRLTYAAANLNTSIENTVASESIIRDVDMAAEMTTFTKNQILMQAGTAMLAQANMAPQSILQLLK